MRPGIAALLSLVTVAQCGCDQLSLVSLPIADGGAAGCGAEASECAGACVLLLSDNQHCGGCGARCKTSEACVKGVCREARCSAPSSCPAPLHAPATCTEGHCARGPCEPGFFDFDGPAQLGCEASCIGRRCILGDGGTVVVTNEPLPEAGLVFSTLSSGSSLGAQVQTSSEFSNFGVLGEPTPSAGNGVLEQTSAEFRNIAGFGAIETKHGGH